ncbi:response regulator transcription factor [Paraburkholderia aspalathi]|uniref:response regulator transcription factor n=1 Tax=Paraburkholderia aspalathi TaxID=1324617 RepID=UPI002278AC47|nr:helix-turn-helix transcriptional regulator [Paraburkholderia aspalathi]
MTPREKEVFALLRLGQSNKMIANHLGISLDTARRYSSRIKQKTKVSSAIALPCIELMEEQDWLASLDLGSISLSKAEMSVLRLLCRGHSGTVTLQRWSSKIE